MGSAIPLICSMLWRVRVRVLYGAAIALAFHQSGVHGAVPVPGRCCQESKAPVNAAGVSTFLRYGHSLKSWAPCGLRDGVEDSRLLAEEGQHDLAKRDTAGGALRVCSWPGLRGGGAEGRDQWNCH